MLWHLFIFRPQFFVDDSSESDLDSEHERCETITEGGLKKAAARWILRHREAHRIPHAVMESIVSGAKSLYETALMEVRHQVIQAMKDKHATADTVASVSSVFDTQSQYTCVFKGLETTHKQNTFIKDTFYFVVSDMKYKTSIILKFFLFAGACSYSFGYSCVAWQVSDGWHC